MTINKHLLSLLGSITLAILAQASVAENEPSFSIGPTESCVAAADHWSGLDDCIFLSADACMNSPNGSSTMGTVFCLEEERAYWDERLNQHYQDLRSVYAKDLPEHYIINRAEALQQMQRDWIAYRDSLCTLSYAQYGYGSMRNPASASCHLQETARQAIILKRELGFEQIQ